MDQQRLNNLIDQYLRKKASEHEISELNNWYTEVNYDNKELDEWIRDEYSIDTITNRMFNSFQDNLKKQKQSRVKIIALRWASVAAIALLTVGLFFLPKKENMPQYAHKIQVSTIKPGSTTATLTLGNGSAIILGNFPAGRITGQPGVVIIKKKNGLLTYSTSQAAVPAGQQVSYNSIETPRGGEYQVVLPDGTNVWLNAASKLTYPTRFNGNKRIVKLSGEAYFEVTHNARQPFHVLYNGQDLRVLGTHFNVNSYPDDSDSKTTLLQGSIALTNVLNHTSVMLTPGQQAATLQGSGKFMLHNVNVVQVVSWKNGYFQFDNMNIASVMNALSRWYNFDVKYDQIDLKETYGGTFSRNSNLQNILNNIAEVGGIRFQMNGRTITVTSKKGGL